MKKIGKKFKVSLGICLGSFVVFTFFYLFGWLDVWEYKIYDSRFHWRGPLPKFAEVVIVSVDEKSITALGRFPWSRAIQARLVDKLTSLGAKVIAFDILFTEPETENPEADQEFAESIRRSNRVILGCFYEGATAQGQLVNLRLPIPVLKKYARVGFVNIFPESDGVARKIPLMTISDGKIIPSLALGTVAKYLDKNPADILNEYQIPTYNGEMLINYHGGYQEFPYYSAIDVLSGKIEPKNFQGKIVLVGGTATGLFDFKATPYTSIIAGVEIHANTISNIINRTYLRQVSPALTILIALILALLIGYLGPTLSPWLGIVFFTGFTGFYILFSYILFTSRNTILDIFPVLLTIIFSYGGTLFYRFVSEEREKRWIKKTFAQYLSPNVLNSILNDPSKLALGGQRENLTVLFTDIRGFTTISESKQPEEVVAILNEYLSEMVKIIFKYDGTLDKFIGDAIMAFWGAPIPQNDHPRRAIRCALEMTEALKSLNEKWAKENKPQIKIGIGLNSGDMVVGNMGSAERMDYTVIGDNVNLASRLEGLTKEYGTTIIISESTYNAVKDLVEVKELGEVKVKGKTIPVKIYTVTGSKV